MNKRISPQIRNEILKIKSRKDTFETSKIIKEKGLNTVCTSSRCPNLNLCFSNKTATFLLLGNKCTRSCPFCNIGLLDGRDLIESVVDRLEPEKIAFAVQELNLKHAVITMVTRDDLHDGGSEIIALTVKAIKSRTDCDIVEVLTSDFCGNRDSVSEVLESGVNIFGHNIETVERLYGAIRPNAGYRRSLDLLKFASEKNPSISIKSGFMVGLGETDDEVFKTIDDLIAYKVDFITIGQYLRPSLENVDVDRFVPLEKFIEYRKYAIQKGVKYIQSAPLVRSSFGAEKFFKKNLNPIL